MFFSLKAVFCALLVVLMNVAFAFPTKPIKIVVTIGPGSSADILARIVSDEWSKKLNQPVIVENKPGAGGNVAADFVAKSVADGHTLLLATISTHAINAAMYPSMSFDPIKDFAPIVFWCL